MHPHVDLFPERLEHTRGQGCARNGTARADTDLCEGFNGPAEVTTRQLEWRTGSVDLTAQGKDEILGVRADNGLGGQGPLHPLLNLAHQAGADTTPTGIRMDLHINETTGTMHHCEPGNRVPDDAVLVEGDPGDDVGTINAIDQRSWFPEGDHLDVFRPHVAENNVLTHVALLTLATPLTSLCPHSFAFCEPASTRGDYPAPRSCRS